MKGRSISIVLLLLFQCGSGGSPIKKLVIEGNPVSPNYHDNFDDNWCDTSVICGDRQGPDISANRNVTAQAVFYDVRTGSSSNDHVHTHARKASVLD